MYVYKYMYVYPPKNGKIELWYSTNGSIADL